MKKSKYQDKSQIQNSNIKTKVLSFNIRTLFLFLAIILTYSLQLTMLSSLFAQDSAKLTALSKQIMEAKTNEDAYRAFEDLKGFYFGEHKYKEFVDFLNSLAKQKKTLEPAVNYYIALARYYQLEYLEEAQNWNEYFGQGSVYRDQIAQSAQKSIDTAAPDDSLGVYSRLILWKFHKDQQDNSAEPALENLMDCLLSYAKKARNLIPIKDTADEFVSYGERAKAHQLYKVYVEKLVASNIKDEKLNSTAMNFFKEGNLDLAEEIYDVYLERMAKSAPKEKLMPALIEMARNFAYKDEGQKDPVYAEKLFKQIEQIGGKEVFDEELMYLRAFNLEKIHEYKEAKDVYLDLAKRFPSGKYTDEAIFKAGIIYTYILRDPNSGKSYFAQLAAREKASPQVISALYQLGLLSQWSQDYAKAKEYYSKLLAEVKDDSSIKALVEEELKEAEAEGEIEYNLKTFLDTALKEEYATLDTTKLNLKSTAYKPKKGQEVNINTIAYMAGTGCMEIQLQYLWSGDIGIGHPVMEQPSFATQYNSPGTKVIGVVVVSPTGIVDRALDMVDVE